MAWELLICALFFFARGSSSEQASLCSVFVSPLDYPCEEHQVTSEDGFIIGMQRVPFGHSGGITLENVFRVPVLLQHGLMMGGDAWFLNSPSESLGFVLAAAGFDVWISNGRGTIWSAGHQTLSKHDKKYWDWTWDELATYDIPAMLEYIYKITGSKVHYVGHSQGTIIGLAALTEARVRNLVFSAALLSPISYLDHITSKFLKVAAFLHIDTLVKMWGFREFNLYSEIGKELVEKVCAHPDVDCGDKLTAITGPNCCFNNSRIPYYLMYEPQPTSLKNMQHLAQMIRTGSFRKYNYGALGNVLHYFSFAPPTYDISSIPDDFPVWMAYGGRDCLSDAQDVQHTLKQITCKPKLLYLDEYAHIDFVVSTRAKEDLYDDMIAFFVGSHNSHMQSML